MAFISTATSGNGPLTLANPTLVLTLDPNGENGVLVSVSGAFTGLKIAIEGSADDGASFPILLDGIRTDVGAVEAPGPSGSIPVSINPSAWRVAADQLSHVRLRVVGLTSGNAVALLKSGSF